ncbi:hypothetical protein [Streptacidiphilus sp. P02-A3a]|uniref:Imm32 family immunity protein n=1 Tax=Streptacidiphilus sp. P02-A3a TaxID=2704468 RepID=UPI001CDB55B8|nr:hypothetical protein [Streptacidiphilus sp. P02-A3a]
MFGEADLTASAAELSRLATTVADGAGLLSSTALPGGRVLAGIEVRTTPRRGVLLRLDAERQVMVISGGSPGREAFADNLRRIACAPGRGQLHVSHFPGHPYLVEGSLSLVVYSPYGGLCTP